VGDYRVSIPN